MLEYATIVIKAGKIDFELNKKNYY